MDKKIKNQHGNGNGILSKIMFKKMMKKIFLASLFLIMNNCNGQKNNQFTENMKTFNVQKFEENKGKGTLYDHVDMYDYKNKEGYWVVQYGKSFASTNDAKVYQQIIFKEYSPFKYYSFYFSNGLLAQEIFNFNKSAVLIKEYNLSGNIIRIQDFDKDFRHSFEQIHEIVLKEKNIDIYDTRQAIALRHDTPNAVIKKYYQIHVLKSKLVGSEWQSIPDYSFIIDDVTGKIIKSSDNDHKR